MTLSVVLFIGKKNGIMGHVLQYIFEIENERESGQKGVCNFVNTYKMY